MSAGYDLTVDEFADSVGIETPEAHVAQTHHRRRKASSVLQRLRRNGYPIHPMADTGKLRLITTQEDLEKIARRTRAQIEGRKRRLDLTTQIVFSFRETGEVNDENPVILPEAESQ